MIKDKGQRYWSISFKPCIHYDPQESPRVKKSRGTNHKITALPRPPTARSTSPSSLRSSSPWMLQPKYWRPGASSEAAILWGTERKSWDEAPFVSTVRGRATLSGGYNRELWREPVWSHQDASPAQSDLLSWSVLAPEIAIIILD